MPPHCRMSTGPAHVFSLRERPSSDTKKGSHLVSMHSAVRVIKQKSRPQPRFFNKVHQKDLSGLYHRSDASGAQSHANLPAVFHHGHLLQVRVKSPVGGTHRETAAMTKRGGFATRLTFCHDRKSFPAISTKPLRASRHDSPKSYHRTYLFSRRIVITKRVKR